MGVYVRQDEARYQVAGYDKEDVHTDEAPGGVRDPVMVEDHCQHSDGAQPVDLRAVRQRGTRLRRLIGKPQSVVHPFILKRRTSRDSLLWQCDSTSKRHQGI